MLAFNLWGQTPNDIGLFHAAHTHTHTRMHTSARSSARARTFAQIWRLCWFAIAPGVFYWSPASSESASATINTLHISIEQQSAETIQANNNVNIFGASTIRCRLGTMPAAATRVRLYTLDKWLGAHTPHTANDDELPSTCCSSICHRLAHKGPTMANKIIFIMDSIT